MGHFYSEAELTAIKALWLKGLSAAKIAKLVNAEFETERSRNSILGLAHRRHWPDHSPGAEWAAEGQAKREATMKARGIAAGRKPKPPTTVAPVASEEPVALGKPGEYLGHGCRWIHGDDPATRVFCGHQQVIHSAYCEVHRIKSLPPAHGQPKRPHIFMNPDRQFR